LHREPESIDRQAPLVVDLDGTLIRSDLLVESLLLLAKKAPLRMLAAMSWLARGRAYFKCRIAREVTLDVATLPYDRDLIAYLEAEKKTGRELVLASGADDSVAKGVAEHLGLFDRVFASDGRTNLSGEPKRDRLVAEFHLHGFDYVGNGRRDGVVCAAARKAILVRPVRGLRANVEKTTQIERVFDDPPGRMEPYLTALRPHQWLKNVLVFAPLALDYHLYQPGALMQAVLAFAAFSLCASSGYLFNDLLDLPSDRRHPHKKDRPLASGQVPAMFGIVGVLALLLSAIAVALLLPWAFLGALAGYFALSLTYSFRLKDIVILDVLALSILYTLRVVGGALAVGIALSSWLLAFCIFLFFSLALVKRYAELVLARKIEGFHAHARAYLFEDRELLAALGGSSGYLAALVLGLYIGTRSSHEILSLYQLFWLDCLLLLYWITYMWLMAHRGQMDDDPLVFGLRDRVSRILLLLMAGVFIAATLL
jgi:4-hydroxybenzoate polyprenyltransferase/phosphoserine phosphatase